MTASIRLKRVYEPPAPDDGARVLVDRLWPRGIRREALAADLWLKDLAPSPALRRWYGHDPSRFAAFAARYRAELEAKPEALQPLVDKARAGRVTLLTATRDLEHSNARVLRDYLVERLAQADSA